MREGIPGAHTTRAFWLNTVWSALAVAALLYGLCGGVLELLLTVHLPHWGLALAAYLPCGLLLLALNASAARGASRGPFRALAAPPVRFRLLPVSPARPRGRPRVATARRICHH